MNIKELCYELYKEDWKVLFSVSRIAEQRYLIDYYLYVLSESDDITYEEYIKEYGYSGNLYACYNEFLDTEYKDEEYMLALLRNKVLQEEYLKDIKGADFVNDFKDRCRDCACLVVEGDMWHCDKAQDYCSSIKACPKKVDNYEI